MQPAKREGKGRTTKVNGDLKASVRAVRILVLVPDGTVGPSSLGVGIVSPSVVPPFNHPKSPHQKGEKTKQKNSVVFVQVVKNYANRSMIGAQFLWAMRARRWRRALSISFRYSVSTTGNAMVNTLQSLGVF